MSDSRSERCGVKEANDEFSGYCRFLGSHQSSFAKLAYSGPAVNGLVASRKVKCLNMHSGHSTRPQSTVQTRLMAPIAHVQRARVERAACHSHRLPSEVSVVCTRGASSTLLSPYSSTFGCRCPLYYYEAYV